MIRPSFLLYSIVSIVLLWGSAVVFDVTPYLRGPAPYPPDWRWAFNNSVTLGKVGVPFLTAAVILCIFYFIERKREQWNTRYKWVMLGLFVILSMLFQFAVLYSSSAGVNVIVHRIISPTLNGYFTAALDVTSIGEYLNTYNDNVLQLPMHAKGHPAGSILIFWLINVCASGLPFLHAMADSIAPQHSDVRVVWNALTASEKLGALMAGVIIPFISAITIIPLYFLAKLLYGQLTGIRAVITYIFIPSIVLFIPINDVFLPLFPVSSAYFLIRGLKQNNRVFIFVSGLTLSLGLFMSLSIIPLIILSLLFFIISYLKREHSRSAIIELVLMFLFGILVLPIMLFISTGYNTVHVSQTILSGQAPDRQYFIWVMYNLYDFFILSGLAFSTVFLIMIMYLLKEKYRKNFIDSYFLPLTVFMILMLLDISGIVRAEVGRIWIPFVPFLLLPSVYFLTKKELMYLSTKRYVIFLLLLIVQLLVINQYWILLY